ncbi:MAG TPA: TonB family protein [Bacteroidales bacterium]|jgi:protein TonB|nr:TonB family protein [Bacteroidales bacterium]
METKKSNRADLEKKKILFLQSGLIVSLGLALAAFEWRSPDSGIIDLSGGTVIQFDEDLPSVVTTHPIPPAPVVPRPTTIFHLVDNTAEVEDITPPDFGDSPEDANQAYTPVLKPELTDEKPPVEDEIFINSEKMPEFPGGEKEMLRFIGEHIAYPREAREIGVSGIVYLTFVIEKDGSVSNVKVLRGIGSGCDEEAVRVISLMPKWSPGMQRTKPVRVSFNMPIAFKLKDA